MQWTRPQYTWRDHPQSLNFSQGGQAVAIKLVYKKATQTPEDLPFVCKVLPCAGTKGAKYINSEYHILKKLTRPPGHPNIVRYEDFEYRRGTYNAFLYLEFCQDGDLSRYLKGGDLADKLTNDHALHIIQQISSALAYLHYGVMIEVKPDGSLDDPEIAESRNDPDNPKRWTVVLHRDIKPHNIFISSFVNENPFVKLGDFGLAKIVDDSSMSDVGSGEYIAPECRRNETRIESTPKSDIWSFGKTIEKITLHSKRDDTIVKMYRSCCVDEPSVRPSSLELLEGSSRARESDGSTVSLLFRAILKDDDLGNYDRNLIRRLLGAGINPSLKAAGGGTSLHLVASLLNHNERDLAKLIKLLWTAGVDPNVKDTTGRTALSIAAARGNKAFVKLLLTHSRGDLDFTGVTWDQYAAIL